MKFKDAPMYRRETRKRPANPILPFDKPAQLNEVILVGEHRLRITAELTREEFLQRLRANLAHADGVAAQGKGLSGRAELESIEDRSEPSEEIRYFYAAEFI